MGSDTAAIEYNCNFVRRHIQEEFPDLAIIFIVYSKGEAGKALERRRSEIEDHPAGRLLLPLLQKLKPKDTLCALAVAREKKAIPLMARKKTLACVFIAADDAPPTADTDRLRQRAYSASWDILNALSDPQTKNRIEKEGVLTITPTDETIFAWHNMLADAFSALVMEMQGKKGAIRSLAKRRGAMALETQPGYAAEHYPYPVVMDAAQLVYNDMNDEGLLSKTKIIAQALEMSQEIGITFDQSTVLQWWAFSKAAQEMAWLNIDKNKILGAAVHTSEDPYARATAYLVAESLGIDPAPASNAAPYNAFTDPEVNERRHRKTCDEAFQVLLPRSALQNKADNLRQEAARQNKKLLEGQVIGWCAPALLAAADAFDTTPEKDKKVDAAKKAFQTADKKISGETLRKLVQSLVALRRASGKDVGPEHLALALREDKDLRNLSNALLIHPETGK